MGMNKTAIAIQHQPTISDLPMPQGGVFTVYGDGTLYAEPESSAVKEFTYLTNSQTLVVRFVGNEHKEYFYDDVPAYKIFQMLASESIGAFIAKAIKPHHEVWSPEPRTRSI